MFCIEISRRKKCKKDDTHEKKQILVKCLYFSKKNCLQNEDNFRRIWEFFERHFKYQLGIENPQEILTRNKQKLTLIQTRKNFPST